MPLRFGLHHALGQSKLLNIFWLVDYPDRSMKHPPDGLLRTKFADIGEHELILEEDDDGSEKADYSVFYIIGAEIVAPVLDKTIVEVLCHDYFVVPVPHPL